jgi:tRNA(Ile2) C34 agmatinyltransferase TiaS
VLFIGLDDTDDLDSRGTGHLARAIAADLALDFAVVGVTRHQLLVDPRIPYTKKNSSAAILLDGRPDADLLAIADLARERMLAEYVEGSDPGLCVAQHVPPDVVTFGRRAQREVVTHQEATELAAGHGLILMGLGGDRGGVIGALAAVGLAATGQDGRYVLVGRSRELSGLQTVDTLLASGITAVQTVEGVAVTAGLVQSDKLRPARRSGRCVLVVERAGDHWLPVKLD